MKTTRKEDGSARKYMVDAMFGKLGRILRLLGFDTKIANSQLADTEIETLTLNEDRLLITHDHAFYQKMAHQNNPAYFLKELGLHNQVLALFRHLALDPAILIQIANHERLSRCTKCNAPVAFIAKQAILDVLREGTANKQEVFWRCTNETCRQVYWIGGHWDKLHQLFTGVYTDLMRTSSN